MMQTSEPFEFEKYDIMYNLDYQVLNSFLEDF